MVVLVDKLHRVLRGRRRDGTGMLDCSPLSCPILRFNRANAIHSSEFHIAEQDRAILINVLTYGSQASGRANVDSRDLDPYIEYVCTALATSGSRDPEANPERLIQEFAIVVEYFSILGHESRTIGDFVNARREQLSELFEFHETSARSWRSYRIYDAVSCISLWVIRPRFKKLFGNPEVRDKLFARPGLGSARHDEDIDQNGNFTIRDFAEAANLLPRIEDWVSDPAADPREAVPWNKLNARLITRVGRIEIAWTFDISEHMLHRDGKLYVFCMPSRLVIDPTDQDANTPERALM